MKIEENSFDTVERYKLYRTVKEIIHPTISKKNISRYIIVLKEELYPLRIFYPEKITNINKIIFYIHGDKQITNTQYSNFCTELAITTNQLVICIDYDSENDSDKKQLAKSCETIKFLLEEIEKLSIENIRITLSGDSKGANMILMISEKLKEKTKDYKKILFYPLLTRLKNYYKTLSNNTMIIIGSADPEKEETLNYCNLLKEKKYNYQLLELNFLSHALLKEIDSIDKEEIYTSINNFLNL